MSVTTTNPTPDANTERRRRLVRVVIIGGIALVAINLVIFGFAATRTGTQSQTGTLPSAIETLSPVPGSTVRPQDSVRVDLTDGLTGDLYIDGKVIPADQTEQVVALGVIAFRPGPKKEITQFAPGRHTVEVRWRPVRADADQVDGSYSWSFSVA